MFVFIPQTICTEYGRTLVNFVQHYKYFHFYSICLGLGFGTAFYRPFYSLRVPSGLAVFCTIAFEIVGFCLGAPAHTRRYYGPLYHKRDVYWGLCFAVFAALWNLNSHRVYTLSCGCGLIVFALIGTIRKCISLTSRQSRLTGFRKLSGVWISSLQLNAYTCFSVFLGAFLPRNMEGTPYDFIQHCKYYHFFALCFGLGCGMALYRPFRSLIFPSFVGVFFAIVFEIVGFCLDAPPHTSRCKGPPYDKRDVIWGFCFALFVAVLHLHSYHVYTLSYGWGIIVFALRGAKRKYSYLRKLRERKTAWW